MDLHLLKFDSHQIVLIDLTFSEYKIDEFCGVCKILEQIEKTNVVMPEKVKYLDLTDIEKLDSHNDKDAQFHDDDDDDDDDDN